ncbi:cytidylyltransferase domain-containing protein [Paenibacillus sp. S150]|uniref:acylneuraminate cytidylyltransferase family protein n=1 Tax=Paenibacillus sp. S150 TaxID=2749826 RepID=UPI001C59A4AC|nr:acylneuraminate cytidylyltransferase family protein [Paenibacillus sp. S150]MBW4081653.1 acylneuraminate cytidylyltransferase family protein [Paenibacillus sp. S150]
MSRICTICARGGSKGVPNKNLKLLAGKPLISYSIEQAQQTGLFEYIAVSSDSTDILEVSRQAGADFMIRRPEELAQDTSAKLPAIRHCLLEVEKKLNTTFDVVVDLDATSPLRFPTDISNALELLSSAEINNVITGMNSRRSPYFNLVELNEQGYAHISKKLEGPVYRRQDAPKCYDMNGSIYVWRRDVLLNEENDTVFNSSTLLYEMPEERSIDIDSALDWKIVELLMSERLNKKWEEIV